MAAECNMEDYEVGSAHNRGCKSVTFVFVLFLGFEQYHTMTRRWQETGNTP
jgi:hypothetical protein